MELRSHERARQESHGLVVLARLLALVLVVLSLAGGVAGGLLRACTAPVPDAMDAWLVSAAVYHAALMIGGFLGTVIAVERAVAVKRRVAFLAPLASSLGGVAILLSHPVVGAWLLVAASVAFIGVNIIVVRRQNASHTRLLLVGAGAWLAGNLFLAAGDVSGALPWWFSFLVLTIAAERLDMTRLTRRGPEVEPLLWTITAMMLGGAALVPFPSALGGAMFGASLFALAAWLFAFDVARRTVLADGLSRYMAVCLLTGYGWLMVAGVAWAAMTAGLPTRDAALHALGLGFVVSMMMAHAPVILPAVTRIKVRVGTFFYVPLAVLNLSLVIRLGFGHADPLVRGLGALMNAVALGAFAVTILIAAIAWRVMNNERKTQHKAI
jgi:hypothetical protein